MKEFLETFSDLKSAGSCPESRFSLKECVSDQFQNNELWYHFNCSAKCCISTLILYHWLKSAAIPVQLFTVPISKWEVKGTLEEGETAMLGFQVKTNPLKTFCKSVAFVNFAVFLVSVGWSLLSVWFVSKTTSPFPHSICDATNYAACSQPLRRSESGPPRGVHLYQQGPPAAGPQCY